VPPVRSRSCGWAFAPVLTVTVRSADRGASTRPTKSADPADFPLGALGDEVRISRDIEGRPLSAPFVAGRRVVGGDDEAIRPGDFDAITQAATGSPARVVPASEMGGNFGSTRIDPVTRPVKRAGFRKAKNIAGFTLKTIGEARNAPPPPSVPPAPASPARPAMANPH
jgi:hypothetical protein